MIYFSMYDMFCSMDSLDLMLEFVVHGVTVQLVNLDTLMLSSGEFVLVLRNFNNVLLFVWRVGLDMTMVLMVFQVQGPSLVDRCEIQTSCHGRWFGLLVMISLILKLSIFLEINVVSLLCFLVLF